MYKYKSRSRAAWSARDVHTVEVVLSGSNPTSATIFSSMVMCMSKRRFQGFRPEIFGDVWDKMSTKQRRWAFYTDMIMAVSGAFLIFYLLFAYG